MNTDYIVKVLQFDFSPLLCSSLFWINKWRGGRITVEKAGMDGSRRGTLAVLTTQSPRGLTLDVAARRLYWISDLKKVDVNGNVGE